MKTQGVSLSDAYAINMSYSIREYIQLTSRFFNEQYNNKELDLLIKNLNITFEDIILDIPCGYGRLTNPLANIAKKVVGVDINGGFLTIAEKNSLQQTRKPTYINLDIRKFQRMEEFDVAIVAFNSFGLFEDDDNELFIKNLSLNLKNGGRFMIEILNPEYFSQDIYKEFKHVVDDLGIIDKINYNHNQQILFAERTYTQALSTKIELHQMKVYRIDFLEQILNAYNLRIAKKEYALGILDKPHNDTRLMLFGYKV